MAVVAVLACDLCRAQPAETWSLTQAGKPPFTIDLCEPCSKPLRDLRRNGRQPSETRTPRRRTGLTKSVTYPPPAT